MPSSNRTFAYYVERDAIAIVKRQVEDTSNTYASPSEVKTVTIFAIKRPNLFVVADTGTSNTTTGYTQEPDLPEEFTHTIVAKAIQRGYELSPDSLSAAQYWERQFEKGVNEGKRYANTGRLERTVIRPQGFEPTVYPTRSRDEQ